MTGIETNSKSARQTILSSLFGWPLLAIISSLGLFLRLLYLNQFGLSLDEALSVYFASSNLGDIAASRQFHNNPPLYFLIAHGWLSVFTISETSLRALSVVIGTLTIPMIAFLGTYLWDRTTGWIAAFIMAVMIFPIHYSQVVRNYSLFLLFSTACFYFFIRSLERDSKWDWLGYVAFTVALVYTHTYATFLLLVQNIYVFLFYREKRMLLRWLIIQIVIVLCTLPWLIHLFQSSTRLMVNGFWIPKPVPADMVRTVRTYFTFLVFPGLIWVYALFILYALLKPFRTSFKDSQQEKRRIVLLFLWAIGSILPPFLLSLSVTPFYFHRYTIGSMPAFYLLFSYGLKTFPKRGVQIVAGILILFSCAWSLQQYYHYSPFRSNPWQSSYFLFTRHRWRELIAEMKAHAGRRDLVTTTWAHKTLFSFYAPRMQVTPIPALKFTSTEDVQLRHIEKLTAGKRRLWLIFGLAPKRKEQFLLQVLRKHYSELKPRISVHGEIDSSVYLFHLKSRQEAESHP